MESTGSAEECLSLKQANARMGKPVVTKDSAIDWVKVIYGLQVTKIEILSSFSDLNFHIKVSTDHTNKNIDQISDDGYTLKFMNTLKSNWEGHFDAIHGTMKHLYDKGLRVPQPITNVYGKTWQLEKLPLQEPAGEEAKTLKCGIHLLTYIPGEPIASIEKNESILFQWGELLAKFHMRLKDFDCPELMKQWTSLDAKLFNSTNKELDSMDPEAKKLVEDVLSRFSPEFEKRIADSPQGFLHGDFNDHNILFRTTETDSCCVDGILDFDEMHHGSYAWDLGAMLGRVLLVNKEFNHVDAVGHAVAGYQKVRKLNKKELSLLKMAMECRVSLMCRVSAVKVKGPSNAYVDELFNLEPKKRILKFLSDVDDKSLLKNVSTNQV